MTPKQFFTRWGDGIKKVTPFQQIKVALVGSSIILIGIILGVFVSISTKLWWLLIILIGTLIVQGVGLLGSVQKYLTFKKIEEMTKHLDNDKPNDIFKRMTKEVEKNDIL